MVIVIFSIAKYENATIGCDYKWVITKAAMSYIAFRTDKGLENWLTRIRCSLKETKSKSEVFYKQNDLCVIDKRKPVYVTCYMLDTPHKIIEKSFYKLDEIPSGFKPFIGLNNGSLVTCYYLTENGVTTEFRPNPNATPDRVENGAYIKAFDSWDAEKRYRLNEM